jgi:kynurenine formamidase
VDTSLHVNAQGVPLTEFAPEEFLFTQPAVVDMPLPDATLVMPAHLEPHAAVFGAADLVMVRFGLGRVRREEQQRFIHQSPGFGVESAAWIRDNSPHLRCLGMDVPSLALISDLDKTFSAHNELLDGEGNRFLVIEEMNLEHDLTGLREVRLCPWLVEGMDSGPCSVIAVLD